MVHIQQIEYIGNYLLKIIFDDGVVKTIDFRPFIGNDELSGALKEIDYFKQVKIYENGRGIYWPNSYDFCPDYMRYYIDEQAA